MNTSIFFAAAALVSTSAFAVNDATYPEVAFVPMKTRAEVMADAYAVDTTSPVVAHGEADIPNVHYVASTPADFPRVAVAPIGPESTVGI